MKRVYLLLSLVLLVTSCVEKEKQSVAEINLENGYVFVDGTGIIIHWDEKCKRAHKNILLVEPISEHDYRFCSCVPIEFKDSVISYKTYRSLVYNPEVMPDSVVYFLPKEINKNVIYPIKKYMIHVDGKYHQVSEENIKQYGMGRYASSYPNATVRMRDDDGTDYDIPIGEYYKALSSGLHPFVTIYKMRNTE